MLRRVLTGASTRLACGLCLWLVALHPAAPLVADDSEAEKRAIARIQELGGQVLEIAQNDNRLDVSFLSAQGKVTDEFLLPLKDLPRLAILNLRATEVTDAGLAHLAGQKGLIRLHLEKTKITDQGLASLKDLGALEYLNLYGTAVTDAGLVHLEGLTKLQKLFLWQTQVTDAGVERLQKALPQLKIIRGQ